MDADRAALNRLPRWLLGLLLAVPAAFVAVFYAWPLITLLTTVIDASSIGDTLRAPGINRVLWFTFWQAVVSTALTLLVGFIPAYMFSRYRFRGRAIVLAVVTVPFMLPTVVVGAAFVALLPRSLHGTALAVVAAHVFFNVAVVVRLVGAMWSVLPHDLTASARTLGASPGQMLRHVVVPLLAPALWAAGAVVFLFTFTSFGVVKLLGGPGQPTLEVEIARRATQLGDVDGAAVLSLVQLIALAAVVALSVRWQRRAATAFNGHAAPRRLRTRSQRLALAATTAAVLTVMLLPLAALVRQSVHVGGRWTLVAWRTLGSNEVRPGIGLGVDPVGSLWVSLRFALVATVLSVAVGGCAALAITAARRRGRLLDLGVMLPLGTSAVTIGFGMLITFDTAPFDWRSKWWLIPVGHALVATPFVVRAALPILRAIPADRRAAAATLGASPSRTWVAIDLQALRRPLLIGAGFAAAISLGEFGATTFLTRSGRETLPIAVDRLLARTGDLPRAQGFAVATMLMLVTAAIIVGVETLTTETTDARD